MNNHQTGQISNKRDYVRQCLYCEKIEVIASGMICRYRGNIIGGTKHTLTRTDYYPKLYLIFWLGWLHVNRTFGALLVV